MHEYDVALSFAGENRAYVEEVARCLTFYKINVFYDDFEQVNLWGKDLFVHLSQIYEKTAKYVVVFVSKHYAEKVWTKHELKSAQARALIEADEYILPARFDDTEIPGLLRTTHYINLQLINPGKLARLIVEKVKGDTSHDDTLNSLELPNFTFSSSDGWISKTRTGGGHWYNDHKIDLLFRPSKNRLEIELEKAEAREPKDVLELTFVFAEQAHQYVYTRPIQLLLNLKQHLNLDWIYQAFFEQVPFPQWVIDGQSLANFLPPLRYLSWIEQDFRVVPCEHQTPRSRTNDPSNSMAISFTLTQP